MPASSPSGLSRSSRSWRKRSTERICRDQLCRVVASLVSGNVMPSLRLLADDLTGALDTAAEFVGLCGPVEVRWANRLPAIIPQSLAIDSGTREYPRTKAAEIVHGLAPLLHDGTIAYKKVDSLMRGAWPGELAACFRLGAWRHCVMAPAFPYQERRTQGGRQFARSGDGSWSAAGADIATELRAEGLVAVKGQPDRYPRRWDLCLRRGNRGRSRPRRGCRPQRSGTGDLVRQRRPCPRARPRS